MKRTDLRTMIREELNHVVMESSRKPEIQDVDKFISNVLKMGSRDNMFDSFMKREGIAPDELTMFVYAVAMRLKDKWT